MSISSTGSSMDSLRSASPAPSIESVPDRLAPAVFGPMVWDSSELDTDKYVVQLTRAEIDQIRAAVIHFKLTRLPRGAINRETFPLSTELAERLTNISDEIHSGAGVSVLRGLDTAKFNDEEAVIAFAGVSSYVGASRATDSYANQTLSHVRDATHDSVPEWAKDIGLAGSKITSAMDFHSDRFSGDILALHVRNDGGPGNGGDQHIVSVAKIYNEILQRDPAVLETMATPDWPFELKQKNSKPYLELGPTLFFSKGKPILQLVKAPLLGSPRIPRDPSMPSLTTEQMHALEVVEELARKFSTKIDRQVGDIQFIHNLSILHARSAYGANGQRSSRHLLRMFLRDPERMWEKPATCRNNFDDPFAPGRHQELPILDLDPWRKISGRESHG
ncbi:taurine catabolism dioxygenase TauD [Aaosphaeria arxii CBS 175.79]|uniref:Taurine catabolism dioxygenase TauD n=1 Tax=Aaosphaeria arxii CBS 175.79 TaxID=1450172 RepID=A0A6A5XVY0_9PLEO|nr:taurine catabolism dioxygenase TauD [Aaosphaeria arxii CBS 175.79]KAF2017332.1 taurine catabolism dioxygenase TauD [Aaosphaeria arxii CBS 175.79]